jgi:hypothetical protein
MLDVPETAHPRIPEKQLRQSLLESKDVPPPFMGREFFLHELPRNAQPVPIQFFTG